MHKLVFFILAAVCCLQPATAQPSNNLTGILGAFGAETTLLLSQVQQKKEQVIQGTHFTEGILNGAPVVIAQTGIGKVNAAITTTLLLEHFKPARVLFTGIAGGVNPQLSPGDLIIGTRLAYHDYGAVIGDSLLRQPTKNPLTLQENPLYFPCDSMLVQLANTVSRQLVFEKIGGGTQALTPTTRSGLIVTGDVFVSSANTTQQLWQQLHAEATEMEGAAVAQTCWQQQVPFLVIRSLSDKANSHAAFDITRFYEVAAHNSARLVMAIVGALKGSE